jgi:hypothetical protein
MGAQAETERILLLPKSKGPRHSNSSGSLKSLVSKVTGAASSAGVLRVLAAFGVSGGWMFVSSLLILINKHILKDLKFGWVPALCLWGSWQQAEAAAQASTNIWQQAPQVVYLQAVAAASG